MKAQLFIHGSSQAIRLPKELHLQGTEVEISLVDGSLLITPIAPNWKEYFEADISVLDGMSPMERQQDLPQERDFY